MKSVQLLALATLLLVGLCDEALAGDRSGKRGGASANRSVGIDRAISNGGLDLSDDDEDDGAFPRVVDEKLEEQKRVTSRVQDSIQRDNKVKEEDFFHQDIEDNDRRARDE